MDKIKKFYQSFGFITGFIISCVIISAIMGEKFLNKFLMLVLASQILFNVEKVLNFIESIKNKELNKYENTNNNLRV